MYEENRLPVSHDHGPSLPADVLLIVPVRNVVMFPGAVTQVALGRDMSMRAAQEAVTHGYKLGIVLQKDPSVDVPGPEDLYKVGTTVSVVRYIKAPNGVHHLICQGEQRFRTLDYLSGLPFLAARYDLIPDQTSHDAGVVRRLVRDQVVPRGQERQAGQVVERAEPLLALADQVVDPVRRLDVAHDADGRADLVQVLGSWDVHARVLLQDDAELVAVGDGFLRRPHRHVAAERHLGDGAGEHHDVSDRHDQQHVGRQGGAVIVADGKAVFFVHL